MIYFCSDLHFFHKNIILYSKRPFSTVKEMNETLVENWNKNVNPNDTIYHLGDFSFGSYEETKNILAKGNLNGKINLIIGNHDQQIKKHRQELIDSGLVESIEEYKELKYNNHFFVLFHYPIASWNKKHHGAIHIHGHCHGSYRAAGKIIDVGVDDKRITEEYRPISIEEIIHYMKNVEDKPVDHHI